jgi:hypothetical protein
MSRAAQNMAHFCKVESEGCESWCPGAVALGHPWPSRHRCIHALWDRTTDTRIFNPKGWLLTY